MNKRRLVIGNWKMYVESPEAAKKFAQGLRRKAASFAGVEAWLAPPFVLLPATAAALKGSSIKVGAQSVSPNDDAKHTGEVSAAMLKAAGASFVIVGHSETRAAGMTDAMVHTQLVRATGAGLVAVLCVGEQERDAAGGHFAMIENQLRSAFAGAQSYANKIIVAYEPVWAIGKGADSALAPADLEEMVIFIRKTLADILTRPAALKVPILYGAAVEAENADVLVAQGGVAGLLVGHASSELTSFIDILKACKK